MISARSNTLISTMFKLSMKDIPRTAKLMHDQFPLENTYSWARAVGLKQSNLEYWLREEYLQKPIHEEIGCYGIKVDDEIVGVIINEKFTMKKEEDKNEELIVDELLAYAYSSFDALIDAAKDIVQIELDRKREKGPIAYVSWIACDINNRNKGIADSLIEKSSMEMTKLGYKYSTAFCVSPTASRVFKRRGYEQWGAIQYNKFEHKSKYPFAILPDSLTIMVKELK